MLFEVLASFNWVRTTAYVGLFFFCSNQPYTTHCFNSYAAQCSKWPIIQHGFIIAKMKYLYHKCQCNYHCWVVIWTSSILWDLLKAWSIFWVCRKLQLTLNQAEYMYDLFWICVKLHLGSGNIFMTTTNPWYVLPTANLFEVLLLIKEATLTNKISIPRKKT